MINSGFTDITVVADYAFDLHYDSYKFLATKKELLDLLLI